MTFAWLPFEPCARGKVKKLRPRSLLHCYLIHIYTASGLRGAGILLRRMFLSGNDVNRRCWHLSAGRRTRPLFSAEKQCLVEHRAGYIIKKVVVDQFCIDTDGLLLMLSSGFRTQTCSTCRAAWPNKKVSRLRQNLSLYSVSGTITNKRPGKKL